MSVFHVIKQQNPLRNMDLLSLQQVIKFYKMKWRIAEDAANALELNGYQDPSWAVPIVVLSKEEWMQVYFILSIHSYLEKETVY